MTSPVAPTNLIAATTSNTDLSLAGGEFPSLTRTGLTDLVGPVAANQQERSLEQRTLTLRDRVNTLIANNNLIDASYVRRNYASQVADIGSGFLSDVDMGGNSLLNIAAQSGATPASSACRVDYMRATASALSGANRDWLSTPSIANTPIPVGLDAYPSGYTATSYSVRYLLSGTITGRALVLPTAVGNQYAMIAVNMLPSVSGILFFNINTTGGQTIDGKASLVLMASNFVVLMSDGTNWIIVDKNLETGWLDCGAMTVTATTTNPTKGTTSRDKVWLRRSGSTAHVRYEYEQSAVGGVTGVGQYLLALPLGLAFDSGVEVTTAALTTAWAHTRFIRSGTSFIATSVTSFMWLATPVPYNTTTFRTQVITTGGGTTLYFGDAAFGFGGVDVKFSLDLEVPISGW